MLDIKKVLKRAWHILWNYRILWIFGFILALTAGGGSSFGGNSRYSGNDNPRDPGPMRDWQGLNGDTFSEKFNDALRQLSAGIQQLQTQHPLEFRLGVTAAITFFVVMLLLGILGAVLRYVAENAAIRMVDEYEQSGVKLGFRQAWKTGWNPAAWRLFLVNLITHLPALALFIILVLVSWWIISALILGVQSAFFTVLIAGAGIAFLSIFVTAILMVFLNLIRDFAWRYVALEGAGVMDALRKASGLFKRQWKSIGLMWLVMVGLKIAWGIAFVVLIVPLLVVSLITGVGGVAVSLLPGLLTAGIAALLAAPDFWPWVFAAIVALPFFFVVTFSPVLLVSGWGDIFKSSTWTLTYRELKALEAVAPVE